MEYIAYLHKDRKSNFGVSFPDFPGCVTAGKTLEEARRMAAEVLAMHIAGMAEDREAIPEPSTIDDGGRRSRHEGRGGVSGQRRSREDGSGEHHRARARSRPLTAWPTPRV